MGQRKDAPSPSSISSASDSVSTASTASIHKRSTPKIAAVIIVAFFIISSLAGVTVYFITSEKLLMSQKNTIVEKRIADHDQKNYNDIHQSAADLFDNFETSSPAIISKQEDIELETEDYLIPEDDLTDYMVAPTFDLPLRNDRNEEAYQQPGSYYTGRLGLPTPAFNTKIRRLNPGPRFRNEMTRPKHFREDQDPEGPPYLQYEEVLPTRESNALIGGLLTVDENRADIPAEQLQVNFDNMDENMLLNLEGIFGTDFSKKIEEEITEEPLVINQKPKSPVTQRFFESGMRADPNDPTFARQNLMIRRRFRRPLNPLMRARGQNLYVTDDQQTQEPRGAALTTLDRRPNRPPFHHLGPPPGSHNRVPITRQQPQMQRRMGGVLDNVQEMITLAKSEVGVLRELARNITDNGKELNLWEVLDAVNATVSDNPNSGIAKLMRRFYANYMADENEPQISDVPKAGTYEKSLSSLIFLSFGIFLLNSVNEHLTTAKFEEPSARSFESQILAKLMSDHQALSSLFQGRSMTDPAGTSDQLNNYLRLVLNLMNIYTSDSSQRDVDCVWQLYCLQLNQQASLGGMASAVAKINSVGMKLVLEEIPASAAIPAVFRSMIHYKQLQCEKMFPNCVQ